MAEGEDIAVMTVELPRRMRPQLDRIEPDISDLRSRVTSSEIQLSRRATRIAARNARTDRFDERLDLTDA